MQKHAIVLAAGKGTRMKSKQAKVLASNCREADDWSGH